MPTGTAGSPAARRLCSTSARCLRAIYSPRRRTWRDSFPCSPQTAASARQLIAAKTLSEMCKPQLTGAESGFGVGFQVGKFRGHKSIGHTGAVYGYTASLAFLPDLKIGAVLLSNEDLAVGPLSRLTNVALGRLIEAKLGESVPSKPIALQVPPQELAPLTGEFESPNYWAKIELSDNGLIGNISGQKITLTAVEKLRFLAEGRLFDSVPVQFDRDATGKIISFTALSQKFARVDPDDHADAPPLWSQYVGAYGPEFIPLVVSVRCAHLYATIENELDYRLIPVSRNVFLCPTGMYREEHVVFLAGSDDKVHGVNIANMCLGRRGLGGTP